MSVLSSQAFDAALRQWLSEGPGPASRGRGGPQDARASPGAPAVAVVTCVWQAGPRAAGAGDLSGLLQALAQQALQAWSQRVPGSFCGRTEQGTGLLMVPAWSQARPTVQALQAFLDSATHALGVTPATGAWELHAIGPLQPGLPEQVQRQLVQAGWPVS